MSLNIHDPHYKAPYNTIIVETWLKAMLWMFCLFLFLNKKHISRIGIIKWTQHIHSHRLTATLFLSLSPSLPNHASLPLSLTVWPRVTPRIPQPPFQKKNSMTPWQLTTETPLAELGGVLWAGPMLSQHASKPLPLTWTRTQQLRQRQQTNKCHKGNKLWSQVSLRCELSHHNWSRFAALQHHASVAS